MAKDIVASKADELTVEQLFENSEQYNGKVVTVLGVASIERENTAIRPIATTRKDKIAIWLQFSSLNPEYKKFNQRPVRVNGVFRAGKGGHLGMFDGTIKEIREIQILPFRRNRGRRAE